MVVTFLGGFAGRKVGSFLSSAGAALFFRVVPVISRWGDERGLRSLADDGRVKFGCGSGFFFLF